jgi:hypothetical protein
MGTKMPKTISKKDSTGQPSARGEPREVERRFLEEAVASSSSQTSQEGSLRQVNRLAELERGTYLVKRLDKPRGWMVMVTRFKDGNVKIRVSALAQGKLIQIANVNAYRVEELIQLLQKIYEKLPEDVKKQIDEMKKREQGEEL